ncbi:MAG: alpha/beta hydrolase [Bacteroidetes bacterium]|nr:alpha/beta hydrolase [Bacteroidota bacterium]
MKPLSILIRGKGIPVVLIHGFPLSSQIWQNQESLSTQYTLITPELPGMGETPYEEPFSIESLADGLADALKSNGFERAIILGHSMGGYIALAFASKWPSMVAGLGLVASHPYADSSEAKSGRRQMIERIHKEKSFFVADVMTPKLFAPDTIKYNSKLVESVKVIMRQAKDQAVINCQEAMSARQDRSFNLVKIKVPVGLFYGKYDASINEQMQREIAAMNPNSSLTVLDNAGHMPMMEQPEAFNSALEHFLSQF